MLSRPTEYFKVESQTIVLLNNIKSTEYKYRLNTKCLPLSIDEYAAQMASKLKHNQRFP